MSDKKDNITDSSKDFDDVANGKPAEKKYPDTSKLVRGVDYDTDTSSMRNSHLFEPKK